MLSHAAVAAILLENETLVKATIENIEDAPLTPAEQTMLKFVRQVNCASHELDETDVQGVRSAGWTDEAIYDAVSVCALFNFYNRWCDGTGVRPMALEHHSMSGQRLAQFGYRQHD